MTVVRPAFLLMQVVTVRHDCMQYWHTPRVLKSVLMPERTLTGDTGVLGVAATVAVCQYGN